MATFTLFEAPNLLLFRFIVQISLSLVPRTFSQLAAFLYIEPLKLATFYLILRVSRYVIP